MSNKGRPANKNELNLWSRIIQTIAPLDKGRDKIIDQNGDDDFSAMMAQEKPTPKQPQKTKATPNVTPSQSRQKPTPHKLQEEKNIDRGMMRKISRGKIPVEATLDLHGMTQDQAHKALSQFLRVSYAQHKRCVLVITGKGTPKSSHHHMADHERGILKKKLPDWIKHPDMDYMISGSATSHQKHGGEGAYYIYLKKRMP